MTPADHTPLSILSAASPNRLKEALHRGEVSVGCLLSYDAPWLVETLGITGYDFATVDLEHEPFDLDKVAMLVRCAELVGMTAVVRTPIGDSIHALLSTGAQGVWVPDLRSRAHAEEIVELTRFPPLGRRTYYTQTRAAQYGVGVREEEWPKDADAALLVAAMIEDIELTDELDEILAIDGIEIFHVGTMDLAQSMGQPSPERLDEAVAELVAACRAAGKFTSVGVVTPWSLDSVAKWIDQGVQIINAASACVLTQAVGSFLAAVEERIPAELRPDRARLPQPNKYLRPRK